MSDIKNKKNGRLEVICGSMYSGKSEELIHRLRRAERAQEKVIAFKSILDTRHGIKNIVSHNDTTYQVYAIDSLDTVLPLVAQAEATVVGIDEVQFFTSLVLNVICSLIAQGIRVIVAGLDLDFRGVPFGQMPVLLAIADDIVKLHAVCNICGADAHFTQRLVDGKPAHYDDPVIIIGSQQIYQARCRDCYVIDKQTDWTCYE
ncbi:MAG: thymidine kinase [Candidatus Dependentiae bacterium]|nr:thymidine kinase [Candidatus Dependentiae bacterium]